MGQWIWGSMHGHTLHMRKRYRSAEIAAAGAQAPIASHAWTREPDSHACLNAADSYSVNAKPAAQFTLALRPCGTLTRTRL